MSKYYPHCIDCSSDGSNSLQWRFWLWASSDPCRASHAPGAHGMEARPGHGHGTTNAKGLPTQRCGHKYISKAQVSAIQLPGRHEDSSGSFKSNCPYGCHFQSKLHGLLAHGLNMNDLLGAMHGVERTVQRPQTGLGGPPIGF